MKIIILGAGRVGESVAESLVLERNDITVIDTDPARLRALQERLDLRGVVGNGIQPSVLREAGVDDADMLIACARAWTRPTWWCARSRTMCSTCRPRSRACARPSSRTAAPLLDKGGFAVDQVICPEASVTALHRAS